MYMQAVGAGFALPFHSASNDLCDAMALFARRLCTKFISSDILTSFLSCRLTALNKCPRVWPIGWLGGSLLKWVAGPYQLCADQVTGVEAAIHRVRSASLQKDSNVILLPDKSNTFNSLNRVCTQFRHKAKYVSRYKSFQVQEQVLQV